MQHNDTISNVINGNQYTELNVLNLNFTDAKQFQHTSKRDKVYIDVEKVTAQFVHSFIIILYTHAVSRVTWNTPNPEIISGADDWNLGQSWVGFCIFFNISICFKHFDW